MNILIFGGTFNPIHNGHVEMALKAADIINASKCIVIPTGVSYLKKGYQESLIRYEMCRLAFEKYEKFEISDIEITRSGPSYTYETLSLLKNQYKTDKLYFLIGEDSLRYIENWKEPELIFKCANIICAGRRKENSFAENIKQISNDEINDLINKLEQKFNIDITYFDFNNELSSTIIREELKKGIYDNNKLDAKVIDYIKNNKLYIN